MPIRARNPSSPSSRPDSLSPLMETLAPPVVAVVVAHDPGPWFAETLASIASQDYAELSVLVLDTGRSEDLAARVAEVLPTAYVRRFDGESGLRGDRQRGAVHGGRGRLLPDLPRRRRPRRRRRPPDGGGGLPLERRDRVAQGGELGRPGAARPRGDDRRQGRLGGGAGPAPRDRPRAARRRAGRVRGARRVHPDPGRPVRRARRLRPGHRGHGGGPRPVLAGPGGRRPDHRGPRRPGPPPRGAGLRRAPARGVAAGCDGRHHRDRHRGGDRGRPGRPGHGPGRAGDGGGGPRTGPVPPMPGPRRAQAHRRPGVRRRPAPTGDPPGTPAPPRAAGRVHLLLPQPPVAGRAPGLPAGGGRGRGGRGGGQPDAGPGRGAGVALELRPDGRHPGPTGGPPGQAAGQRQGDPPPPGPGERPALGLPPSGLPVRVPRGPRRRTGGGRGRGGGDLRDGRRGPRDRAGRRGDRGGPDPGAGPPGRVAAWPPCWW